MNTPSFLQCKYQVLVKWVEPYINPLSPKSDQHQISPGNIIAL